jgi:uncharacterized membrane protein
VKITENLLSIAGRQKALADELEKERRLLEDSDFVKEAESLKAETAKLCADIERISKEAGSLADENSSLKNALYEHVFNDKNRIVTATAERLNIYFRAETDGEINKLSAIEQNVKSRIKFIKNTLAENNIEIDKEFTEKLDEMALLMDKKITEAMIKSSYEAGAFSQEEREQLDALKKEEISDEQIRAVAKKNNLERFVGLNVLNVIGIFLLLIGAVTAARYTYMKLSDILKGALIFAVGGIMLVIGEILNRKKPNVFSLGVSAGGIAILYVALAASYFVLQIMGMYPAIAVCVLLTVGAFVLSDRYNSQIIAVFALAGGYLPISSMYGESVAFLYGAMIYFAVLNLFALGVSWRRKWRVMAFIGLSFNIIATTYICLFTGPYLRDNTPAVLDIILTITYAVFAFLIYTAIPIVSTYRAKTNFRKSDVVLLAINTVFSGLIMYGIFLSFGLGDYNGLLAVIFAVFYLFLGRIIEKKFSNEQPHTKALFYLTGLAFVVLIIPLQFGRAWLSLGWLAEGVLLAVYGILKEEKNFRKAGFIICLFCLAAFLIFDFSWMWKSLFVWKYTSITIGSLLILGAYMYKKQMAGSFASVFKYFAILNLWGYAIYIFQRTGNTLSASYQGDNIFQIPYLVSAACITATFVIAYAIARIKLLASTGIKVLSILLYCAGIIWMFANNSVNIPFAHVNSRGESASVGITIAGTAILAVLGILSVLAVRDAMKILVTQRKKGIEWLPLVVSGYFVILLSQNLIMQYGLSFSSAAISIIYVLASLAWIIFGFVRRFAFIRRFGLALAIFAVVKLFLIDLTSLTAGYRIVSYFALGITLLAISFVYQYFSKRLELKEGMTIHAEKE